MSSALGAFQDLEVLCGVKSTMIGICPRSLLFMKLNLSCIHFCFCPCLCFTLCYMSNRLAIFFGDHLIFINLMVCVSCRHCPQLKSKLKSWKKKLPPLMQLARFVDTHMDYIKNHALLLENLPYLDKCLNMAIRIQLCACRRLWGNIMH
jgi:hypothetical protein